VITFVPYENVPHRYPEGIEYVFVNERLVVEGERLTESLREMFCGALSFTEETNIALDHEIARNLRHYLAASYWPQGFESLAPIQAFSELYHWISYQDFLPSKSSPPG